MTDELENVDAPGSPGTQGAAGTERDGGRGGHGGAGGPARPARPARPGRRANEGRALPRNVERAFWAVVVVAFLICVAMVLLAAKTLSVAHQNRTLIHRVAADHATIAQLRRAEQDSCTNFNTMRAAVNDFHTVVRDALVKQRNTDATRAKHIRDPALRKADRSSVRALDKIIAKIHTVTTRCAQDHGLPPPKAK